MRVVPRGNRGLPNGMPDRDTPSRLLPKAGPTGARDAWRSLLLRTAGPEGAAAALQTAAALLDPAGGETLLLEGRYFGPSATRAGSVIGLPELEFAPRSAAPLDARAIEADFPCVPGTLRRLNDSFAQCEGASLADVTLVAAPNGLAAYPVLVEAALGIYAGGQLSESASVPLAFAPWFMQFGVQVERAMATSLPLLGYPGTIESPLPGDVPDMGLVSIDSGAGYSNVSAPQLPPHPSCCWPADPTAGRLDLVKTIIHVVSLGSYPVRTDASGEVIVTVTSVGSATTGGTVLEVACSNATWEGASGPGEPPLPPFRGSSPSLLDFTASLECELPPMAGSVAVSIEVRNNTSAG